MRRTALCSLATVGLTTVSLGVHATASAVPLASAPPSSYGLTTLVSGLNHPWAVDFAPGASAIFYTERAGTINRRRGNENVEFPRWSDVVARGEGGMLGLAVDPFFGPSRPYIYVCFMSNRSGQLDIRIARASVSRNILYNRRDILTGLPVNGTGSAGRHSGCRVKFGPDNHLWITTGDAATGSVPHDPRSLGGKVLRITTSGTGGAGNPGGRLRSEIWAYGFRNPQGIDFRPGDNVPFIIEHGPGRDDEITPLARGGNGGWNPVPVGGGSGYNEAVPMTDLSRYPNALRPVWSSGSPTIAPSGGSFVTHPDWGDYRNRLAVGVLKGQQLRLHATTGNDPGFVLHSDLGRVRTAEEGPDGFLYVLTDSDDGRLIRIDPVPAR